MDDRTLADELLAQYAAPIQKITRLRAVLARYGILSYGVILTREAAEEIKEQAIGKMIHSDEQQFRIVEAHIEGNATQGSVIVEAEEVQEEQ